MRLIFNHNVYMNVATHVQLGAVVGNRGLLEFRLPSYGI